MPSNPEKSTGQATRDDRQAMFGVALWIVFGLVAGFLVRNASIGTQILVAVGCLSSIVLFAPKAIADLFGPVFIYETVRVGRRKLTFILRTLYLVMLTFVLGIVFLNWLESIGAWPFYRNGGGIPSGQLAIYGETAFLTFAPIQYAVILLLTPAYVAGIIADEKERKTLEFLFATDLRNREIIFGKLAARLVTLGMYIIAGLPLLASLMLFGGIDPESLLGVYVGTILTMVTLASVSIFFSTNFKKPRDAIVVSYLMIAAYFIATAILSMLLISLPLMVGGPVTFFEWEVPVHEIGAWVGAINPIFLIAQIASAGASVESLLLKFLITCLAISGFCLWSSIRNLRRISLAQSYGVKRIRDQTARGHKQCGNDPVFWKEVTVDAGRRKTWSQFFAGLIVILLVFCWPILIFCVSYLDQNYRFTGFTDRNFRLFREGVAVWVRVASGGLGFLMMLGAATRGASVITGEKDRDTWTTLISTPLSSWNILIGKWWGAVLGLRSMAYMLGMVWLFGAVLGATEPIMLLPAALYLFTYVGCMAWLGIWISCTARTTLIASIRVVMAGLFLSGGFWFVSIFCCFMPLGMLRFRGDTFESLFLVLLSATPPMVMGWLPLEDFSSLEPFDPRRRPYLGPVFVLIFFFVWNAASVMFALLSYQSFQKLTNRINDAITPPRRARDDGATSRG